MEDLDTIFPKAQTLGAVKKGYSGKLNFDYDELISWIIGLLSRCGIE